MVVSTVATGVTSAETTDKTRSYTLRRSEPPTRGPSTSGAAYYGRQRRRQKCVSLSLSVVTSELLTLLTCSANVESGTAVAAMSIPPLLTNSAVATRTLALKGACNVKCTQQQRRRRPPRPHEHTLVTRVTHQSTTRTRTYTDVSTERTTDTDTTTARRRR